MITDLTYISYDEAKANPKYRKRHLDQCVWFVADLERQLRDARKALARAEDLCDFRFSEGEQE